MKYILFILLVSCATPITIVPTHEDYILAPLPEPPILPSLIEPETLSENDLNALYAFYEQYLAYLKKLRIWRDSYGQ